MATGLSEILLIFKEIFCSCNSGVLYTIDSALIVSETPLIPGNMYISDSSIIVVRQQHLCDIPPSAELACFLFCLIVFHIFISGTYFAKWGNLAKSS
jgi:hypothetical protein